MFLHFVCGWCENQSYSDRYFFREDGKTLVLCRHTSDAVHATLHIVDDPTYGSETVNSPFAA